MAKRAFPLSQVYQLLEPGPVTLVTTAFKNQANVMTMSWHMMMDFEPPIFACIISDQNFTFELLMKTGECVINIPSTELAETVVKVGNVSGRKVDKFQKFHLAKERALSVDAPLLMDCYANLECKVIDQSMVKKYNLFIMQVIKAWIRPRKKRMRMLHHCGRGVFVADGKILKLPSKKK